MHWILPLGATTAIGGLVLLGCGRGSLDSPDDDVSVTACYAPRFYNSPGGTPKAEGNIKNVTKKASSYTFDVRFFDPSGNEIGRGTNHMQKVPPGLTTWVVGGSGVSLGSLTCKLTNITRTPAP